MKSCTNCGALVAPENNICPNCGGMVSNVENNQGVNVAPAPSQVVQPASEPLSSIPVAPAPVPVTEAVSPVAVAPEPVSTMPVVPVAPVAPVAPTPVVLAVDENVTQPQAMPTVAPIPPAPQVVENTAVPTPVVAPTPQLEPQPVQPIEVNVAPVPSPTPEVVPAVAPELISAMPVVPEPVSSVPVAGEPTNLTPTLGVDTVEIPTTDVVSIEAEQKEEKKNKKGKKEPLTAEEKEKRFGRITTVIIMIISVVAIAIIAVFMYKIVKENEVCESNSGVMTTQYSYEGFDFFIPKGVVASVENEEFVLRDTENTWSAVITINDGSYNSLVSNKSQISSYFEQLEYVSTTAEEKEVSGTSFVTTEVLMGSKNVLVAYAKASGTKIYGVVYTNKLGTYDNYSLNIVGEVLASAIYSGYDSAMPAGFTIDMFEQTFDVAK